MSMATEGQEQSSAESEALDGQTTPDTPATGDDSGSEGQRRDDSSKQGRSRSRKNSFEKRTEAALEKIREKLAGLDAPAQSQTAQSGNSETNGDDKADSLPPEPDSDKYDDIAKYESDHRKWELKKQAHELTQKFDKKLQTQKNEQSRQSALMAKQTRLNDDLAALAKEEDGEKLVNAFEPDDDGDRITVSLYTALEASTNRRELMAHLARNPKVHDRLLELSTNQDTIGMGIEIGKLSASIGSANKSTGRASAAPPASPGMYPNSRPPAKGNKYEQRIERLREQGQIMPLKEMDEFTGRSPA